LRKVAIKLRGGEKNYAKKSKENCFNFTKNQINAMLNAISSAAFGKVRIPFWHLQKLI
jgi:hypothetical protein